MRVSSIPARVPPKQHLDTDKQQRRLTIVGDASERTWKRYSEAGMKFSTEHRNTKHRTARAAA